MSQSYVGMGGVFGGVMFFVTLSALDVPAWQAGIGSILSGILCGALWMYSPLPSGTNFGGGTYGEGYWGFSKGGDDR